MGHDSTITTTSKLVPTSDPQRVRLTIDGTNVVEFSGDAEFMELMMPQASQCVALLLARESDRSGRTIGDVANEFLDKLSKAVVGAMGKQK